MGLADIGDYAEIGLRNAHKLENVIRVTRAHFDHCELGRRGDFQQRERNSDVVVQVSFRGDNVVFS